MTRITFSKQKFGKGNGDGRLDYYGLLITMSKIRVTMISQILSWKVNTCSNNILSSESGMTTDKLGTSS